MFTIHPRRTSSFRTPTAPLDSIISSAICDLDATILASYDGSGQIWANLVASPADGESQTAYDFFLGADGSVASDDPTFIGSAGDAAAHFLYDGGDKNNLASGVNTNFINDMHKTTGGNVWWIAVAFRYAGTGFQCVWATASASPAGQGFEALVNDASNGVRINIRRNNFITNDFATGALVAGTDYLLIVSGDPVTTDDLRVWLNTTTAIENADMSTGTSTTNANNPMQIGARPNFILPLANLTRVYHFSMGNEYLDDTKAADIFTHLETRHQRFYNA